MIRRRVQGPTVPPASRHYLEHGDYRSGPADPADLEVFTLAGQVLRARLDGLRAVWKRYGDSILAAWPDEPAPFAQDVLENVAEGDWRAVLETLAKRRAPSAESADDDDEEPGDARLTFKTNDEE
jgi:hypothetical protein